MSRYHLHAAETVDGEISFQTQEAATEAEAASVAAMLARRGLAVWLYQHEHSDDGDRPVDGGEHGGSAYREIGMFIGDRFLPCRDVSARVPSTRGPSS